MMMTLKKGTSQECSIIVDKFHFKACADSFSTGFLITGFGIRANSDKIGWFEVSTLYLLLPR